MNQERMPTQMQLVEPGEDTVAWYLGCAGETALLSPQEERDLVLQYHAGLAAADRLPDWEKDSSSQNLAKQHSELFTQISAGVQARQRLIQANLRLVVSIAKGYQGRGLPFSDLIQEGNIGLIRALMKYDPDMGTKVSTSATYWIRDRISRAIKEDAGGMYVPERTQRNLRDVLHFQLEQEQKLGRAVSFEEACRKHPARFSKFQLGLLRSAYTATQDMESMEEPIRSKTGDAGALLEDLLPDTSEQGSDHTVAVESEDRVKSVLSVLSPREQIIVRMCAQGKTLEQIGKKLGVSRQRVGILQQNALKKLRTDTVYALLSDEEWEG